MQAQTSNVSSINLTPDSANPHEKSTDKSLVEYAQSPETELAMQLTAATGFSEDYIRMADEQQSHVAMKSSLAGLLEIMEEALRELPLSDPAKQESQARVWEILAENLRHFVRGAVLMAALGRFHSSDSRYFEKRRIADADHEDLTQETDRKLLSSILRSWTVGNIGALRAVTLKRVLIDHLRKKNSRREEILEFDAFPDKCNPFRMIDEGDDDQNRNRMWEIIDSMPDEERRVAQGLAAGKSWPEIVRDLNLKGRKSEIMKRIQDALGPLELLPECRPRRKRRDKRLSTLRSPSSNSFRSPSLES